MADDYQDLVRRAHAATTERINHDAIAALARDVVRRHLVDREHRTETLKTERTV